MIRIKQQRKGYYSALRQNRKIINKRLRKLDNEIEELTGEKLNKADATNKIKSLIGQVKTANIYRRFKYLFTGNVRSLA